MKRIVAFRNTAKARKNHPFILYSETIAVCSEIVEYINTLCGQNVEFVNVKDGGT